MPALTGLHIIYVVTLALAALTGSVKYKSIPQDFKPFVFFLFSGILFELYKFIRATDHVDPVTWVSAFQSITAAALLAWQGQRWGLFEKGKLELAGIILFSLAAGFVLFLLLDQDLPFWLSISPDIIKIAIGIRLISHALINEPGTPSQQPQLLIGAGVFVFYTFSTLLIVLTVMGDPANQALPDTAYRLYIPFGIIANLLFIKAIWELFQHRYRGDVSP